MAEGITLKQLGYLAFHDRKRESDLLVLLKTYIDDSADGQRQEVVAAGAFVGRFGQWMQLQETWRRRLRRDGIAYFRSSEYRVLRGEFGRYLDPVRYPKPQGSEAARSLRDDLENTVRRNHIAGFAVCIPLPLFREFQSLDSTIFTDPFQLAIQLVFNQIGEEVKTQIGPGHRLAFIVDQSETAHRITAIFHEFKRINPNLAESLESITHLDDKLTPPLQAADMMASIAREVYSEWEGEDSKVMPKRLSDRIGGVWVPDAEYLTALLERERLRRASAG